MANWCDFYTIFITYFRNDKMMQTTYYNMFFAIRYRIFIIRTNALKSIKLSMAYLLFPNIFSSVRIVYDWLIVICINYSFNNKKQPAGFFIATKIMVLNEYELYNHAHQLMIFFHFKSLIPKLYRLFHLSLLTVVQKLIQV